MKKDKEKNDIGHNERERSGISHAKIDKNKIGYNEIEEDTTLNDEIIEESSTKYGEFVSSYFAWLSLPKQKKRVEELEKMTRENKKQEDKK